MMKSKQTREFLGMRAEIAAKVTVLIFFSMSAINCVVLDTAVGVVNGAFGVVDGAIGELTGTNKMAGDGIYGDIWSNPTGAAIYKNGVYLGTTPLSIREMHYISNVDSNLRITYEARLDGYETGLFAYNPRIGEVVANGWLKITPLEGSKNVTYDLVQSGDVYLDEVTFNLPPLTAPPAHCNDSAKIISILMYFWRPEW